MKKTKKWVELIPTFFFVLFRITNHNRAWNSFHRPHLFDHLLHLFEDNPPTPKKKKKDDHQSFIGQNSFFWLPKKQSETNKKYEKT